MRPRPALRSLPAVESVLQHPALAPAAQALPRALVVEAVRAEVTLERDRIKGGGTTPSSIEALATRAAARARAAHRCDLRRVLNATGVVLHTNLGRAPASAAAREAIDAVARGYSNLELDLATGRRGSRGAGVERWLTRLTGAEAAMVVNNGAAAILVTLSALADGARVVVSRGELVEIGGSFRIPEIMEKSGAQLVEVGTTNRTHRDDYAKALQKHKGDVAAVLRVHPSNFRIAGFTARPTTAELARLAHRHKVPLIEDLGSGALVDLARYGLEHEPTARECLTEGADVVTFSGDKLLGATQAGVVLGRKRYVERVRRDPLARAVRVDKLTLAALEATLPAYCDPVRATAEVPALAMLATDAATLERRARRLSERLVSELPELRVTVERGLGEVGGGALPLQRLPGWVVRIEHPGRPARELETLARGAEPPVIGYIRAGTLRLDVRTLAEDEVDEVARALGGALRAAMEGRTTAQVALAPRTAGSPAREGRNG